MNLFYQPAIPDGVLHLDPDESRHCLKVLRRRIGDTILITDGKGSFYDVIITSDSQNICAFRIEQQRTQEKSAGIHIAISPTKNADRIEWFVEKAVELGIETISLVECKNSERAFLKTDRLMKVAVSAMKQSLKAWVPNLNMMVSFTDFVAACTETQRFIAYVDESNPDHLKNLATAESSTVVMIGPEGDFTTEELKVAAENSFRKVSLGPHRLRTETAGLAACHILNLVRQ